MSEDGLGESWRPSYHQTLDDRHCTIASSALGLLVFGVPAAAPLAQSELVLQKEGSKVPGGARPCATRGACLR